MLLRFGTFKKITILGITRSLPPFFPLDWVLVRQRDKFKDVSKSNVKEKHKGYIVIKF